MSNFWIGVLGAVGLVIVLAVGSGVWLQWRITQETITPVSIANPDGTTGKALVVLNPGLSAFPEQTAKAFSDGMVESGWRVETTTASSEAPAEVGDYDALILASPVYGGKPAPPLVRYIERIGDLGGKPVLVLLTAAGIADEAIDATRNLVRSANGQPVASFAYTTMRPNDEENKYTGSNTERALQMAREAGRAFTIAVQ